MQSGYIHVVAIKGINALNRCNLVERFKDIFARQFPKENEQYYKSLAIDIFIVIKWVIGITCAIIDIPLWLSCPIVTYLLFFNIFTYFYHHCWDVKPKITKESSQRRYVSFIQAVGFNIISFSFYYSQMFFYDFKWQFSDMKLAPLFLSIANTFATGDNIAKASTSAGAILSILQTFTSFIFLTLILSHTQITDSGESP